MRLRASRISGLEAGSISLRATAGMMLTSSLGGDGRGQIVEVADVFVVHVNVDEPAQLVAVEEPLAEGGILGAEAGPGSRRRSSRPLRPVLAPGMGAQRSGDSHDWHVVDPSLLDRSSGPLSTGTPEWPGIAGEHVLATRTPRIAGHDSDRCHCKDSSTASKSSSVGLITTGSGMRSSRGSWVFRPLPVMQTTIDSSRSIRPCSISFWATARVTPPAVSAQIPSVSAEQLHGVDDRLVVDVFAPAAGLADQLRGEVAVGRVADRQALGDRVRIADRLDLVRAGFHRRRDRVAAGRLGAVHPRRDRAVDQAEPLEFLERLVDLADQAAAGHRGDDVVGRAPAQVLGDLEAERSWSPRRRTAGG